MVDVRELLTHPVVLAPMGGGPSTPALVAAGAAAGAFGFLAAAYKKAAELRDEVDAIRRATPSPFGVNVFVPGKPTSTVEALSTYLARLRHDGYELGEPAWDDDDWDAKIDVLLETRPAAVSFAFGAPPSELVEAFHEADVAVGI